MIKKTKIFIQTAIVSSIFFLVSGSIAATENFGVDPVHSSIVFRVKHLGISYVYGRFHNPQGAIQFDEKEPSKGFLEVQVKAAEINTDNKDRDKHLRSPDFFDVTKYPTISFKSKSIKKLDDETYEVVGDLNLHGITRSITIKLLRTGSGDDPWGGYRVGAETTFTVKRSDFGMTTMLGIVGDEVRLTISIEAIRK